MSKPKIIKNMILMILVVIVGLTVVLLTVATVHGSRLRNRIDRNYAAIRMPSWLHLSDKRYNDRSLWDDSPGVKENWTYTYLPVAKEVTLKDMNGILARTLKSAGYSVVADANPDPSSLTGLSATGHNLDLNVNINADTSKSGGYYQPTSIVQDVEVQAYEP